jgi:DNA modification methylase
LWLLGGHRLVCGDATDPAVFAALLDGRRADMVWTDPPYGVAYTGKNAMLNAWDGGNRLETGIGSDELDREGLTRLLRDALGNATSACRPGASWWTAAPCLAQPLTAYANVLTELGVWHHTLVWVKDGFVLGRSDYHGRHEQLLYGWVPGAAHTPPRGRSQDSVWEIPRPRSNDTHPTMKPVELIARAIGNHTKSGHLVLDPFAGSGSTLIAADQLNRVAALIELDPAYCDVICRRYQTHTGGAKPVLEATGEPHDFAQEAVLAQVTGDG